MKHGYFLKAGSPLKHELTPKIDVILTALNENGAMLAGGFVRDYVLNREFQDIDIFLQTGGNLSYMFEEYIPEILDFKCGEDVVDTGKKEENYSSHYIRNVVSMTVDDISWQFIVLDCPPINFIRKQFDYSINQVFYDSHGIRSSRAFTDTLKTGEVKAYRKVSDERLNDLRSRFSEFTFPDNPEQARPRNHYASTYLNSTTVLAGGPQYQWIWGTTN